MFTLPELDYDYSALSPAISADIMQLHHDKHHQTYVDKLNAVLQGSPDLQNKTIEEILTELDSLSLSEETRTAIRNNGGGHYNHSLFWKIMKPGGSQPSTELLGKINEAYGDFDTFKKNFAQAALGVFGSGWVWLLPDLTITTTANQDSPLLDGITPVLGLDVWEHAYYLDYKNVRPDYIAAWWGVVDWDEVSKHLNIGSTV
ncbi:MAG: superoxide dismutase [Candidatus Saccharibacteria bacterium]|nr:superoxide dismutase [Candidatus Saccharibacteria bacterium]